MYSLVHAYNFAASYVLAYSAQDGLTGHLFSQTGLCRHGYWSWPSRVLEALTDYALDAITG